MSNSCYRINYARRIIEKGLLIFARQLFFLIPMLMFADCDSFEFSPNQISSHGSKQALNKKNLQRLNSVPADDTVTIAFVGDSQRWYSELDRFVTKVNTIPGVDFILIAGDISDFGLLQEFEWMNKRLSNLNKPYFGVIGNHDLTGNGEAVFERMFGPLDFSFVYDSIKFVCHNTNSLEYNRSNIPDINWLTKELKTDPGVKHIVPVSHVPPFSPLEFSAALVKPYTNLFSNTPKLLVSLHGHVHNHNDFYPFEDNVRYITSFSFEQNSLVLLRIFDGKIVKSIISY